MKGYSYRRYSDAKQGGNDSLRRQYKDAWDYCASHGLELDDTLTFEDTGVSAWKGKNRQAGALKAFLQAIEDGLIESGSLLLVESFDRLSREGWLPTAALCQQIANSGVNIVVLKSGRIYDLKMLNSLEGGITLVVEACLAEEESNQKSRRVKKAWIGRKEKAIEQGDNIAEIVPNWLSIPPKIKGQPDTRKITINEERATVIRRIVTEYLAGKGKKSIARDLNADGIPCLSHGEKRKRKSQWWDGTITSILNNHALAGIYKDNLNYFPAIISIDQWNDIRLMEQNNQRTMSPKHNQLVNPLSGVVRCCLCGGLLTRQQTAFGRPKLVCQSKKMGKTQHSYVSIDFEAAFNRLITVIPHMISETPSVDHAMDQEIFQINSELVEVQSQIDNLMDAVAQGLANGIALPRITSLEAHRQGLGNRLSQAQEAAETASPQAVKRRMNELLDLIAGLSCKVVRTDNNKKWFTTTYSQPVELSEFNAKLKMVFKSITLETDGIKEWELT